MIGLIKQCLYKAAGNAHLDWHELEEILLDIELTLNNRPLSYVEDDVQLPVITPNTLTFGGTIRNLESNVGDIQEDLRKRAKFIKKCKENAWKRWRNEYLKSLRERHNMKCKVEARLPLIAGDVVIIKGEEKNRNLWKIGVVTDLFTGKDGVCRAARVRCGKVILERALQHLYPMELHCDLTSKSKTTSEPEREEHESKRPGRLSAAVARINIRDQTAEEEDEL
jgi:hypothetical protein